jgi:hypothetical protein
MPFDINQQDLKEKLIYIYECYLSQDKTIRKKGVEKAKDLDGLWSGSFLLKKEIENAIGGLRYMYLEPRLNKQKAKKILEELYLL